MFRCVCVSFLVVSLFMFVGLLINVLRDTLKKHSEIWGGWAKVSFWGLGLLDIICWLKLQVATLVSTNDEWF